MPAQINKGLLACTNQQGISCSKELQVATIKEGISHLRSGWGVVSLIETDFFICAWDAIWSFLAASLCISPCGAVWFTLEAAFLVSALPSAFTSALSKASQGFIGIFLRSWGDLLMKAVTRLTSRGMTSGGTIA